SAKCVWIPPTGPTNFGLAPRSGSQNFTSPQRKRWQTTPPALSATYKGAMPTEALWKGEPTIAGAVGGIPNQDHPQTHRVLAHSVKDALFRLVTCLRILILRSASVRTAVNT